MLTEKVTALENSVCRAPEETFSLGRSLGAQLKPGDAILLTGGLGAGKTLFTKGIVDALGFDIDEVTSPSFTLVNLYRAPTVNIYHVDLWRIDQSADPIFAIGLDDITEDAHAVVVIEWAEQLGAYDFPRDVYRVTIAGDGDEPRTVAIEKQIPDTKD